MKYDTQELEIDLPQAFRDQTVNALLLGQGSLPAFNLVISRDIISRNETLKGVLKKQMAAVSNQENFKEMQPPNLRKISKKNSPDLDAIEIFIRFRNAGTIVFQKHVYVLLDDTHLLIFVGTSRGLWEDKEEIAWSNLMSSLLLK